MQVSFLILLGLGLCGLTAGLGGFKPLVWPKVKLNQPRRTCPCPDPSQCDPITTIAKREGFAFTTSNLYYKKYDWSKITTLVAFSAAITDNVTCYAHSQGARVSYGADFPVGNLTNPGDRKAWVAQQVKFAQDRFMDGINLDFESGIAAGDTKRRQGLNDLVQELTSAFKAAIPHAQVTFDAPSSPIYTSRHFDYAFIAKTMDFILIMAYDESGSCRIGANSGYNSTVAGIQQFFGLGIPGNKLVLGLPWYGYDYPCSAIDKNNKCTLSPACGRQLSYDQIYRTCFNTTTSGLLWDVKSSTPFFSYKDAASGKLRQAWCDDVKSLTLKYKMAYMKGLHGVGMWTADGLLYDDSPEGKKQRALMWGAMPSVN